MSHTPFQPPRRRFLRGSLALAFGAGAGMGAGASTARADEAVWKDSRVTRHAMAFGTRVSVTVAGLPADEATAAADAALAEMARVESAVSLHAAQSALARLNREGRIDGLAPEPVAAGIGSAHALDAAGTEPEPSPRASSLDSSSLSTPSHLLVLFQQARQWSERTEGAFDVTVQPLWQRYFAASVRGGVPKPVQIEAARSLIGWRDIRVGADRIEFLRPGMQATLNGLAQGYASDCAWAVLQAHGVRHALVDAGEPRVAGSSQGRAGGAPWRLGVRDPRVAANHAAALADVVELSDAALASSGDDAFCFTADRRLHHILDPHSGRSPRELAGVTVLAPDACTADALSTACMVLGVDAGLDMTRQLSGVEALFLRKDGRVAASAGWPGRLRSTG